MQPAQITAIQPGCEKLVGNAGLRITHKAEQIVSLGGRVVLDAVKAGEHSIAKIVVRQ